MAIRSSIPAPPRPRLSLPNSRTAGEPAAKALVTILGAFGDHATSVLISVSCPTAISQATSITPAASRSAAIGRRRFTINQACKLASTLVVEFRDQPAV